MTRETPDHLPENQRTRELVEAFARIFIPRRDCYPIQKPDGSYRTLTHPMKPQTVSAHLRGLITLGTYALDRRSHAKWLCFDADSEESWTQIFTLSASLAQQEIPIYREASRRGGHLWLFFEYSITGEKARRFAHELLRRHEIAGVEIYPKQDRLVTGPGSLMRLPLGVHRRTGQRYPFITADGVPIAATMRKQVHMLTEPQRVKIAFVEQVLKDVPRPQITRPSRPFEITPNAPIGRTPSERVRNRIPVHEFVSR